MQNQDWKLKYEDLKLKFMDAVDVSFRLGMEQGLQQAQVQQAQQASAEAAQAAQMGQPGEDPNSQMEPGQPQSDGSELDQHIGTLESMLSSSKPGSPEQSNLQKSLDGIKAFQSDLKQKSDLKKSEAAIKAIGKAMKPAFTLGKAATKNLSESGKKALNMQEQIVADMMKSFAEEEKTAAESITKTLGLEQLLKP
jgi:RNA-binding protein YhbY